MDARNALAGLIDVSDATPMQKEALRTALLALWGYARDAWTFDEGGSVYVHLQTAGTRDEEP